MSTTEVCLFITLIRLIFPLILLKIITCLTFNSLVSISLGATINLSLLVGGLDWINVWLIVLGRIIFGSYSLKLLPRIFSDHAPLLLAIQLLPFISRKPFLFYTYWLDYIGCINVVKEAWNFSPHGNPMHALLHLFASTRLKVSSWRCAGLNLLDTTIQNVEAVISSLECANSPYFDASLALMEVYAKFADLQR